MDWNRAKNLILIFLLLLNIFLFALIFNQNSRFVITSEQERDIIKVMGNNQIGLYTSILREFQPMRQLQMQAYDYDYNQLIQIFFDDSQNIQQTDEYNRVYFSNGIESLSINNGFVLYRKNLPEGDEDTNHQDAERLCRAFLRKLSSFRAEFTEDISSQIKTENGMMYQYSQKYKGYTIASNYIRFWVVGSGIARIEFMYQAPQNFIGKTRDICSADEALLTCMLEIKNIYGNNFTSIDNMDLVYYQEENSSEKDSPSKASPYYRIYISQATEPFMINAYLNELR